MDNDQLWQATLGELELALSKANFTTWFKNTFIYELADKQVIIGVPNAFTKTWLENKYHGQIVKALSNSTKGDITQATYKVISNNSNLSKSKINSSNSKNEKDPLKKTTQTKRVENNNQPSPQGLNPRYIFENFVVGKKNELAQAACVAVAREPGTVYNPLFIYGGVGLGKTHLMQAIGHRVLADFPEKKVMYVTCEQFTNDFIKSVQEGRGKPGQFKEKYRNVDVLLIDDVQFIAGKESTQEEFFHTFNHLHQQNKQIVVTSDRPPKAIPALENRLISRFEWGMIVDIGAPEFETRVAILNQKSQEKGLQLSSEITEYIANNIQDNIRELEGALNKITAYQLLQDMEINLEKIKEIINPITNPSQKGSVTPKFLITTVAQYFDIKNADLIGACRKKDLVIPRQIVMYLMREELSASFPNIGQEIGGRDHTTAMHAVNKIKKELESNEKLSRDLTLIKQKLYS